MKSETFNKLVEERKKANELIAVLSTSSHASAKVLVEEQKALIKEIEEKLASSEKQFKLAQALEANITETACKAIHKALKSASVDFDAIVTFRYDFKADVVTVSPPRPARAISKAKGASWKYNGKALPASVSVNFGKKGDKAKEYKLVGKLDTNRVYATLEALHADLVACYQGLSTAAASTEKYKASSARDRFKRYTTDYSIEDFVTEVPGETSATAVPESEAQTAE